MKKTLRWGLALTVLVIIGVTNVQAGDPIAAWNQISENAVKTSGHPPPVAALDFAIVQLAIYDAVESIDGRYEPYYTRIPGATGSLSAAAAKAGHDTLVELFPAQTAVKVSGAKDGEFDPENWWERRVSVKRFATEIGGMVVAIWEVWRGEKRDGKAPQVVELNVLIPQDMV